MTRWNWSRGAGWETPETSPAPAPASETRSTLAVASYRPFQLAYLTSRYNLQRRPVLHNSWTRDICPRSGSSCWTNPYQALILTNKQIRFHMVKLRRSSLAYEHRTNMDGTQEGTQCRSEQRWRTGSSRRGGSTPIPEPTRHTSQSHILTGIDPIFWCVAPITESPECMECVGRYAFALAKKEPPAFESSLNPLPCNQTVPARKP